LEMARVKPVTLRISERKLLPVERINRNAREHGVARAQPRFDRPVDHNRLFTCPSLAPLAHAAIFAELTPAQQQRYNQFVGLMQNELICFFEQEFAGHALPALLRRSSRIPPDLSIALRQFLEEERQHTAMFRRLNRLAEATWYATTDYHILRLPKPFLMLLRRITNRPTLLPMVFWIMLLMEERSLMMSKRYAAAGPELIDPQFLEAYRAHAEDEVRHVQIDWHLLEQFYQSRPDWVRRLNARLFEALVVGVFLKPRRANVKLVDLLVAEFPVLRPKRPRLVHAAYGLVDNAGYRQMMYSPEATPISHALFERLPEFAGVRRRLFAGRDR
jgi:hypothetical protein